MAAAGGVAGLMGRRQTSGAERSDITMLSLDPARTALVAIDMHRGHLDPAVATLPLAIERCDPVIARAAQLFTALRARRIPIVHVVTEYRDAQEILANPFWRAIHDDPTKARKRMSGHNIIGEPTTEIIPDLIEPGDWIVRGKKRYCPFRDTDLAFLLDRRLARDTPLLPRVDHTTSCLFLSLPLAPPRLPAPLSPPLPH